MEEERDIVLFLGAGFSFDAGLPTMSQFGVESNKRLKDQENDWKSNNYKEVSKFFTKSGHIFKGFQNYCKNIENYISFNSNNMEDIFCIAEQYRLLDTNAKITLDYEICNELKDRIGINSNEEIKIDELYSHIKRWLWKIYHQFPPLNIKKINETNPDSYNSFFKIIKNIKNRLSIITTNYDIVFEYYSFKNQIKSGYPFNKNDNYIESITKNNAVKYVNIFKDINNPIVFKLHG